MQGTLQLEDGSSLLGKFFGYPGESEGEVVFSTGMVGYPQALTDPSYTGQILTFTYPLIGNYGVPQPIYKDKILQNFESEKIHIQGLIVSSAIEDKSHWQAKKTLNQWLYENKIPGLSGIDTRALTKKLREKGVMLGKFKIQNAKCPPAKDWHCRAGKITMQNSKFYDPNKENLVAKVSCKKPIIYKNGPKKVFLIDCGVALGILRSLFSLGLTIIRVPWNFNIEKDAEEIDGLVISNGPGDARFLRQTIKTVRRFLEIKKPVLGICLGNQILALADSGDIYKLKYGHRSANQPVLQKGTKRAFITSQNHGFAVKIESLARDWQEWFVNLNDGTNEGIRHKRLPFMAVQFHPQGDPGPKDTFWVFKEFVKLL